ncbi:MAG: ATP-dependent nuclease, partial [Burkholderiales bacterium]
YRQCIYRFSAQRKPSAEFGNSGTNLLDREALNLPHCINHLQTSDAHGHTILCQWINRVFPSVQWVEAPPVAGSNTFRLRCLPLSPRDRRDDLATPLSRMGSGIGNVIAMLYVVLTARHPQVIAIDEPNAFLHPRALRELLQILDSEGRQHQYILTAHSPDVLTAISPKTIGLLEFDGAMTTVRQVGPKNLAELRGGLADLGIRMTDLHGRDRVLWVEGQTEELVMPELLRHFCPEVAAGTAVLRVEHTGTFRKKGVDPSEVVKLYRRLSNSSVLVPPMVCILLDGEGRSEAERRKLESESNGVLRFLKKAMLENYLLHPGAVAATLGRLGESTTTEVVDATICETLGVKTIPENLDDVDGANVLSKTFAKLSEARLEFSKTRDVPLLVSWVLENHPVSLEALRRFLRAIFNLQTD